MSEHDTIIPPALPTETDNAKPEPDVMRVGGMVLPVAEYQRGLWMRIVELPTGEAEATIEYEQDSGLFSVELEWSGKNGSRLLVAERAREPEEALVQARAVCNFPPEFFEALSKEIEP